MITTLDEARQIADKAQAEVARAQTAAREAQNRLEAAARELEAKRDTARQTWARRVRESYPTDAVAAEAAIADARAHFTREVAAGSAEIVPAFLQWQQATAEYYALQIRRQTAAGYLGIDDQGPAGVHMPTFSAALDEAMNRRFTTVNAEVADALRSEIDAMLDGVTG